MKLKTNGQRGDICLAGRALYSAGLVNPEQLAAAQEEDVKTTLQACQEPQRKHPKTSSLACCSMSCIACQVWIVESAHECKLDHSYDIMILMSSS